MPISAGYIGHGVRVVYGWETTGEYWHVDAHCKGYGRQAITSFAPIGEAYLYTEEKW